jgi:alkanesulfonate monooxygenase SsuD/methylene tetrahydromethanopterin reductase-like flavin-dependent oxidoreductase (luciferase family)
MPRNTVTVPTYISKEEKRQWADRADERGMGMAEFVRSMVRAGTKKFDVDVSSDETRDELREQRDELRAEVDRLRSRNRRLRDRLDRGERETVKSHILTNPGVAFEEIVEHSRRTAPERINQYIDEFEGDHVIIDEHGGFHPADGGI